MGEESVTFKHKKTASTLRFKSLIIEDLLFSLQSLKNLSVFIVGNVFNISTLFFKCKSVESLHNPIR